MKKRSKKLTLNRETLVQLDRTDLRAAGGGATYTCTGCPSVTCQPENCDYSNGRATCTTCNLTCNTNNC